MTVVASTALITDLTTLVSTAFNAASQTKARTTDKVDLTGVATSTLTAAAEIKRNLQLLAANTDSTDAQGALLANLLATLV